MELFKILYTVFVDRFSLLKVSNIKNIIDDKMKK